MISLTPFDQIVGVQFSGAVYRLNITRDYGGKVWPGSKAIEIRLETSEGMVVFTGNSNNLSYEEAEFGLVQNFSYYNDHYIINLNRTILREKLELEDNQISFLLFTNGEKTLEAGYPRAYVGSGKSPSQIKPGRYDVVIPYWVIVQTSTFPNISTTVEKTTIHSSIPYNTTFKIQNGNATGRFNLGKLGVVWVPTANLSGWMGGFQVYGVCHQISIAIPWQYPDIDPPAQKPSSPTDRIHRVYSNVVLNVALSMCPTRWAETAVSMTSDFGYAATIPYSVPGNPAFDQEFPVGVHSAKTSGRSFERTYTFHWDASFFEYDTGESSNRYLNQTATLVQSPATNFETMVFTPLPETGE